jgi:hypothetical protein
MLGCVLYPSDPREGLVSTTTENGGNRSTVMRGCRAAVIDYMQSHPDQHITGDTISEGVPHFSRDQLMQCLANLVNEDNGFPIVRTGTGIYMWSTTRRRREEPTLPKLQLTLVTQPGAEYVIGVTPDGTLYRLTKLEVK